MKRIDLGFGIDIEITSLDDKRISILKNSMAEEGEQLRLLR